MNVLVRSNALIHLQKNHHLSHYCFISPFYYKGLTPWCVHSTIPSISIIDIVSTMASLSSFIANIISATAFMSSL
jgi:hypothetical protein